MSYYKRYISGECEAVWRELCDKRDGIRTGPILEDAKMVADEMVVRSLYNFRLIKGRLLELGYKFKSPDRVILGVENGDLQFLEDLETRKGVFPLLLKSWFQHVGVVDFTQTESQIRDAGNAPFPEEVGNKSLSVLGLGDGCQMLFYGLRDSMNFREILNNEMNSASAAPGGFDGVQSEAGLLSDSFFPLGGWSSDNSWKGFTIPSLGFDEIVGNEDGGVYFYQELKYIFKWGGFPKWRFQLNSRFKRVAKIGSYYQPDFGRIVNALRDGLKEI